MIPVPGRKYDFRTSRRWRKLRREMLPAGTRCTYCGAPASWKEGGQLDHRLAAIKGGQRFDKANLVPACGHCNKSKGSRSMPGQPEPESRAGATIFGRSRFRVLSGDYSTEPVDDVG